MARASAAARTLAEARRFSRLLEKDDVGRIALASSFLILRRNLFIWRFSVLNADFSLEDCVRDLVDLLEITEVLRMPLKDVLNPFLRLLETTLKEPLRALPDLLEMIVALRKPRKEVLKPTLGLLETIVVPR